MQINKQLHCNVVEANTVRHRKKKNTQADKCNLNPKIFQWPQLFGHEETKLDFYLYVTS